MISCTQESNRIFADLTEDGIEIINEFPEQINWQSVRNLEAAIQLGASTGCPIIDCFIC
jgi:hypothetical protein